MKPITKATQRLFTPLLEEIPSYKKNDFKNERIELVSKQRDDGTWVTVMDLYSVRPNSPNEKFHPTCLETSRFPNRLFEKRYVKNNKYGVPLTDANVEIIFACWPWNQIILNHSAKQQVMKVLAQGKRQDLNAKVIAQYAADKTTPNDNFVEQEDKPLLCYQKVGRHCGVKNEAFALFMEQGTGKTPTAISVVVNDYLKKKPKFYRALIICPNNVRFNWEVEIGRFCPIPHKVTVIRGTKIERQKKLIEAILPTNGEKISFAVASYGALTHTLEEFTLKSVAGLPLEETGIQWDMAILDESHYIKSPRSKRTKACHKLRDASKKRLVLTGTPYVNSLYDLWAPWEFMGKYLSGASNYNAFREIHAPYDREVDGPEQFDRVPLLQERLARTSFRITKKDAMPDLPEKVYDTLEVDMTPEQAAMYQRVANQLFLEIENELGEQNEMKVNNILTKLLRLAQVTSGFLSWDAQYSEEGELIRPKSIDRLDPNNKLEALIPLLKEKEPHEKSIVWACFEQDLKTITGRLKLEGIDSVLFYGKTKDDERQEAERRFNEDSSCKVFVGNPAAGGVGLNLLGYDYRNNSPDEMSRLTNCSHIIYYSQNWSLTARAQSEDRAHRRGTRQNIRITDLTIPGSIDEEIRKRVMDKITTAIQIQDVKYILDKISNPTKEDA